MHFQLQPTCARASSRSLLTCLLQIPASLVVCGLLIGCATTQPEPPNTTEPAEVEQPVPETKREDERVATRKSDPDSQNRETRESEPARPTENELQAERQGESAEAIAGETELESESEQEAGTESEPTPPVRPPKPAERISEGDSISPEMAADETGEAEANGTSDDQPLRNLEGQIEVLRNGREQRFASTHLNQTVVAWRPAGLPEVSPMEEQQIVTRRSRFYPQTIAVTSGTLIRFPNLDDIRHNVFSLTPDHKFDVGMYGPDEGATRRFTGTGMVEIYCNIHPNMAAFLLVLDTPHFITPDDDGYFILEGLPPGPGELLVWNYRADEWITKIEMPDSSLYGELAEVTIDITRPSVPQHLTKDGQPYRRRGGN